MRRLPALLNVTLLRKSLADARALLLATMLIMFAFCWLRVWIVSLFPTERFQTIVEQFREFERFLPVPFDQLFTLTGRIAMTYDELIVVMCMVVWAIARGSDSVSGELNRGTLEMLLAQPIGRIRLLATQAGVTAVGTGLIGLASWLGIFTGIHTTHVKQVIAPPVGSIGLAGLDMVPLSAVVEVEVPMRDRVDARIFWPATVNLMALGFFLTALTTLLSSWDRFRWRTIGLVAAIYVVQLIMKIAGLATERLNWLLNWTFFTCYDPERFVSCAVHTPQVAWHIFVFDETGQLVGVAPLGHNLVLVSLGVLAYLTAAVIFHRRDLPAPA